MIQEIKLINNGQLKYAICFNIVFPFPILR